METLFQPPATVAFGRFRVLPHRRAILANDKPLKLGGRAFDVLMALIEARGTVVSKHELKTRVWPGRFVEENNLQVQISTLRAAFGAERELIRTVPGRGYQFAADIRILRGEPDECVGAWIALAQPAPVLPPTNVREPVSGLIGRDDELRQILDLAAAHRLVTLTGAGGIGKIRLALAAAYRLMPQFAQAVWFADLAPLAAPDLVPVAVATAVSLEFAAGEIAPERVANALSGKKLLLVLDNCEHVIDAAVVMAEALLRANPAAHVIATSREPLKADGERIYPVPPLAVPAEEPNGDDPLRYGAVRLFVERARAAEPRFAASPRTGAVIAAICRRLDGLPLAIELAAARAAALGIDELAARLDDRFHLLTGGRRTALPRHQTLRATLDWSFELLTEPERMVLRRLAVFAGGFDLQAASATANSAEIAPAQVCAALANLVAKSLVTKELDATNAPYRLLDTTRVYALEKLIEGGERERTARRHAEYYRDLFERVEAEWEWLSDYARQLDNLRVALDWAFSPDGDPSIGVALTAAAIVLWLHLSLLHECRIRVEQALSVLRAGACQDARREMKLQAALAGSYLYSKGPVHERGAAWAKALEIAESLHDAEYQLRSLYGLCSFHLATGQFRAALGFAQRFCTLAAVCPDPNEQLIGERVTGIAQHYLGDQVRAREHIERMLANFAPRVRASYTARFQWDQQVAARTFLARTLWLQGLPDQAVRAAENAVDDARSTNHAISMCYAMAHGPCVIALWVDDHAAAERYVAMLLDLSTRHAVPAWAHLSRCYQAVLLIRRGEIPGALRLLRTHLDQAGEQLYVVNHVMFLGEMAEAFGRAGRFTDALASVEQALERSERNEERWLAAELLRIKGELLLLQGTAGGAAVAEDLFRQALEWARRQGALSWELRAATSLARLLGDQCRFDDATALLQPVYDRFTEGFDTADLKAAKGLLDVLERDRI